MKIFISSLSGAIFLSIFLVSCGGGGSSSNTANNGGTISADSVNLPLCILGTGEFSGCWISELCANDQNGNNIRLLHEAAETTISPAVSGRLNSFLLRYGNNQCTGNPIGIINLNTVPPGEFNQVYIQQPGVECSESGGTTGLQCTAFDITITQGVNIFTGLTTQLIAGERLCMPGLDYNFDSTGNGGIQGQSTTQRDTVINLTTGECLNRFIP